MPKPYSQLRAMMAITKFSLKAVFRSPSAVIFSFVFPLIFILVFGFIGNSGRVTVRVAFDPKSDTTNDVYNDLKDISVLNVVKKDSIGLEKDLEKGRLSAIISIKKDADTTKPVHIHLKTSEAVNPQNIQVLRSIINGRIQGMNYQKFGATPTVAIISEKVEEIKGRTYRTIDFILPGQLGFS
jgi:ABC-2 type transport system permease protein